MMKHPVPYAPLVAAALLALIGSGPTHADDAPAPGVAITRDVLFEPVRRVDAELTARHGGLVADRTGPGTWSIAGTLEGDSAGLRLEPVGGAWDFSGFALFSIELNNAGPGTVWVEARLDNTNPQDWSNSSMSQCYLLPGERGTVTVAYPRHGRLNDAPPEFAGMAAMPNGWRSHWKGFDPADVKGCRIVIRSSEPEVRLTGVRPALAWRYGAAHNRRLLTLPYLDRFGQAIPFDWPTKIETEQDLHDQREQEHAALRREHGPGVFNRFGGWADGPQHAATGFFRAEKIGGRWWLIDPEGRRFWSHGSCSISQSAGTPISNDRRALFAELPEPGTPEHAIGVYTRPNNNTPRIDFLRLNTARKYGEGWEQAARETTHRRMRAWGLNTLGAWSDRALFDDARTPYTEILHVWHGPQDLGKTPDPFHPGFEARYHDAVANLAETRRDDPWMLGVFIDNEIHWHGDMVERVLNAGPGQPAYDKFVEILKAKYADLDALNRAWESDAGAWDAITPGRSEAWRSDRDDFYRLFADRYYRVCKSAMAAHLPNHLYLGSRIHNCPWLVADQAAKHVDVFSVNHYWPLAGTGRLPGGADLPVMITEFHFGTVDRGVMGMSLSPVHDQAQRSRSYAAYVLSALMHPNIVGVHWFAWADQSAVGRPGENYQMGFIDITDTPYAGFTTTTRAVAERMYDTRSNQQSELLPEVTRVIHAPSR